LNRRCRLTSSGALRRAVLLLRLKAKLAAAGVAPERLARLKAPAGLDLGAITPDEIAVSILAEIVAVRRGGHRGDVPAE
jgi:xanthine/CO dehydrogenase XdhC/CoxF family maturation factor